MGFSDLPWPETAQLFPKHAQVQEYIEDYSRDVRHLINFETQVIDLQQHPSGGGWTLKTQPITRHANAEVQTHHFDAIVLANGHFNIPYIPSVPGLSAWSAAHPGAITHSKFYRRPEAYTSQKVIIVGNSASGIDIASQIAPHSKPPLLISSKSESYLQSGETPPDQLDKPPIAKFILENRTVEFQDGSRESHVDAVLYCTGYFYSFPFVSDLSPALTTTGERVENLYKHLFYRPNPTLALPVLNQKVIPFPFAEAQAAVVARVFSGHLELPPQKEMEDWERREVEEKGDGRGFHVLKFPRDAEFINEMHDWAVGAEGEGQRVEGEGGKDTVIGKKPPYWGEKEFWTRERFPAIKKAFQGFGEGRHEVRTLSEVGFDFEAWKEEKDREVIMNDSYGGIIQMFFSLLHVLYTLVDDTAPSLAVGEAESFHPSSIQPRLSSS
jgi:cation diffusion facilitator CzcD-associated flavoprotein CzcO